MNAYSICYCLVLFMMQRSIFHVGFHLNSYSVDGPEPTKILGKIFCTAAEQEEETGEKILELLSSVCNNETFPFGNNHWYQNTVLLDLYSYVKNYETQTGRSVLPSLQPVFQSAPTVWSIDLSERKVSLLLEVMKLQPEKKPVELRGCSDEESEVKIFLQCLPYISKLRLMFLLSFIHLNSTYLVD